MLKSSMLLSAAVVSAVVTGGVIGKTQTADAAGINGVLNIANPTGGGAVFSSTAVDFIPPVNSGIGDIVLGSSTGDFSGLTTGTIKDVTGFPPSGLPISNFLTFNGSDITYTLTGVNPATFAAAGTGTTATLLTNGFFTNSSGVQQASQGIFTAQFPNLTPAQLQSTLASGGSLTTTYSASFATAVPEASNWAGVLLAGTSLLAWKLKRQ